MILKMTGNIMVAKQSINEGFFSLFFKNIFKTTARREFQLKYTEGKTLPSLSTDRISQKGINELLIFQGGHSIMMTEIGTFSSLIHA